MKMDFDVEHTLRIAEDFGIAPAKVERVKRILGSRDERNPRITHTHPTNPRSQPGRTVKP